MKLTSKDKAFLDCLRQLLEEKDLWVDFREDGCKRLILRQNYGDRIETHFGMSRQGVRWRFQRLVNEIYVEAYQTILWIETTLGTELRPKAMAIAQERANFARQRIARNHGIVRRER
jgi:hypothetical protein